MWHLTFAQLLLYFLHKPACQCLEMHCVHVVHWAESAAWQTAPKYIHGRRVSGGIHFLFLFLDCRRDLWLVGWFPKSFSYGDTL